MLDVRTGLAATGKHQHRLNEHLAAVTHRQPCSRRHDRLRQRITDTESVGKRTKQMQPDMGDDLCATISAATGTTPLRSPRECPPHAGF
jgi:hypothetical protein